MWQLEKWLHVLLIYYDSLSYHRNQYEFGNILTELLLETVRCQIYEKNMIIFVPHENWSKEMNSQWSLML